MRKSILILLILSVTQAFGSIPEVKVTHKPLLDAIDVYLDSVKIENHKLGVLVVIIVDNSTVERITPIEHKIHLNYDLTISMELERLNILAVPPSSYFVHRNIPVLIYSGVERLVKFENPDTKKFIKKIEYRLPEKWEKFVAIPPVMKINIKEDGFEVIEYY